MLAVWAERPSAIQFLLVGLIAVPIDLVRSPFWWIRAEVRDSAVPREDLVAAVRDIVRARELGFVEDEIGTGYFSGRPLHLDRIGYDAAWLESVEFDDAEDR